MRIFSLMLLLLCLVEPVMAAPQRPLMQKPLKLDQSGRPVYNSWEYEERQRQGGQGRNLPRQIPSRSTTPQVKKPLNQDGSSGSPNSGSGQVPMTVPPPGTPYLPATPPLPSRQTMPVQLN